MTNLRDIKREQVVNEMLNPPIQIGYGGYIESRCKYVLQSTRTCSSHLVCREWQTTSIGGVPYSTKLLANRIDVGEIIADLAVGGLSFPMDKWLALSACRSFWS